MKPFPKALADSGISLTRKPVEILQVNIGRKCNQACHHCHVESSPIRTENMIEATVSRIIEVLDHSPSLRTIDITGGAPELNPNFRRLVLASRARGLEVIDRCNLTVLFEKGQEDTAQFLAEQGVTIIASLPCYSRENVEKQRGSGVFNRSIEALKILNGLGYGTSNKLKLNLVYNPTGPFLPPDQSGLERDYKRELKELFGIEFDSLLTITNMPIKRFLTDLQKSNRLDEYMELLANSFNPAAAMGVMCRSLLSVSWNGELHDCDFNQMLELPIGAGKNTIWDIDSFGGFTGSKITLANHCYACTAGAGSSCGGSLV